MEGSQKTYFYRGEQNKDKILEDLIIGAYGEWAAYEFLRIQGIKVSKPDMAIYSAADKTFKADLIHKDYDIHVKSQGLASVKRYGNSWLLQKSDKVVKEPSLRDILLLTNVADKRVQILGLVLAVDLKNEGCHEECRVFRYRDTKVALYFDNIKQRGIVLSTLPGMEAL
jgi:hypothetical protein